MLFRGEIVMEDMEKMRKFGREDAEYFIRNEKIDYEPFVAISDLYLVRKTVPVTFVSFRKTVEELDPALWESVADRAKAVSNTEPEQFSPDDYAIGFAQGVAAVWDKIRDQVITKR